MSLSGINVIGYIGGNLGLGVAARQVIRLALDKGIAVAACDLSAGFGRDKTDDAFESLCVPDLDALPHAITILVVALAEVGPRLAALPERFFDDSHLNAVLCFWELPTLPFVYARYLSYADVVISVSDFMTHAFSTAPARIKVIPGRLPVWLPPVTPCDLLRHGVPADAVSFIASLELHSDPARKNPLGLVDAFLQGVGDAPNAYLLLRINNPLDQHGRMYPFVGQLKAHIAGHPRVRLLLDPMTYPEVLGLYQACSVYVSLHRSEGLGLGIAEALTLGRPVIATGWSGNMIFMSHMNSLPVGYDLVPVRSRIDAYRQKGLEHAVWAQPDLQEASKLMKLLVDQPGKRRELGSAAAASMKSFNTAASQGVFLDELQFIAATRKAIGGRRCRRSDIVLPRKSLRQSIRKRLKKVIAGARDIRNKLSGASGSAG